MHDLLHWIKIYGYLGIFASLSAGMFGLPIPDETILTFTGFLIYKNYLHPVPAVLAAVLGSLCGITLNYLAGRFVGFPLLQKYGIYIRFGPEKLAGVEKWFERYGKWALAIGYFLPGVRHFTAFTSGASRLPYWIFAPFAYAGGGVWVLSFITLGYFVGEEWSRITPQVQGYLWEAVAGLAALTVAAYLGQRIWRLGRNG